MGETDERRQDAAEPRSFEECRTIDVSDQQAMRFWSHRLGVPETEIAEAVRVVGPNSTAVALKLDAPEPEHVAPAISPG